MKVQLKEDIMKARFEDVYDRYRGKELSCVDAADILGISERSFLRFRRRYEEDSFTGRFDRRLGRPPPNKAADDEVESLTRLYTGRFRGFSVKHFHDYIKPSYPEIRSYNWCRQTLQEAGLIQKVGRGGPHRQRRDRKTMEGLMLHQDASTHDWIPGLGYNVDLIVTMDDATSEITSAFFTGQEGTISSLRGISETIKKYGLFCSLYTDRGSHYAYTPEAGGKVLKGHKTQVGRALDQLGIRHIHAYSPEARGRSERMFGTLQGRLPKEMALHCITTLERANAYLQETYLPLHNATFKSKAERPEKAYTPWLHHHSLEEILCLQNDRLVQKDNTVRYEGLILQIPKQDHRHHYVKCTVSVREYLDGQLGIFYGHHCLGRYDQRGQLLAYKEKERKVA
jgi:transposase